MRDTTKIELRILFGIQSKYKTSIYRPGQIKLAYVADTKATPFEKSLQAGV